MPLQPISLLPRPQLQPLLNLHALNCVFACTLTYEFIVDTCEFVVMTYEFITCEYVPTCDQRFACKLPLKISTHDFFNKKHIQGLHNSSMMLYVFSWLFATKHCDNIKMLFYHTCFLFVSLTMLLGP